MGSFAHSMTPGCIGRLHALSLRKAMIFQKKGIWAGFLENTAQHPLMREMNSERSLWIPMISVMETLEQRLQHLESRSVSFMAGE